MEIGTSINSMTHLLPVDDVSRVGEARRLAQKLAQDAGANEPALGRIGIVVTEAATNLIRHAQNGKILLRIASEGARAFEVICIDSGPGITDLERCLRDGYSSIGTTGTGLGAIRRMSDNFSIFSLPGRGTTLHARIQLEAANAAEFAFGAISIAHPAETVCGDAWAIIDSPDRFRIVVADGLGHGPLAFQAAQEVLRIGRENTDCTPAQLLELLHRGLKHTRGAAVMIADAMKKERSIRAAGVGNIAGFLVTPTSSRGILSHAGIVGHEMRTARELTFEWPTDGCVVFHSDGLSNRWSLAPYPGLLNQPPVLVAATLFRDAMRTRDDATVVAISRRT